MDNQPVVQISAKFKAAIQTFSLQDLKSLLESYLHFIKDESNWFYDESSPQNGGPLHWVLASQETRRPNTFVVKEMLTILLEKGCPTDFRDLYGSTPLHSAVTKGSLPLVVTLLSHMADPNLTTHRKKTTPLHLVARSNDSSLDILKALIVFNADLNLRDAKGMSALHLLGENTAPWAREGIAVMHAVKAARCPEFNPALCSRDCKYEEPDENDEAGDNVANNLVKMLKCDRKSTGKRKYHLLCLDGGGIRGVVLTQMLTCFEKIMNQTTQEYFNCIAGTSTGGILGLGLASGKSVMECQGLYFQLKDSVFKGAKAYGVTPLENFLKKMFGENRRLDSLTGMRVMVTATNVTQLPPELHLFRNYPTTGQTDAYEETDEDTLIWKAAKLTGAAPFYFQMEHHSLVDGGFVANNPTLDALAELSRCQRNLFEDDHDLLPTVVVSLGTSICLTDCGSQGLGLNPSVWNFFTDPIGLITKVPGFSKLLLEQVTASNGPIIQRGMEMCNLIGSNYIRLNPQVSTLIELDETDDAKLINLIFETRVYTLSIADQLRTICS